jgi:hypothetical protein
MRGSYAGEVRVRVIQFVDGGGSRREAAEQFDVSVSSAIRWVQRFREDGTCEPMPRGGARRRWRSTRSGFWLSSRSGRTSRSIRRFRRFVSSEFVQAEVRSRVFRSPCRHLQKSLQAGGAQASRAGSGAPTLDPRARPA